MDNYIEINKKAYNQFASQHKQRHVKISNMI